MRIRIAFSVDHHKKKALSVHVPYALYLHFVTSPSFEAILPQALREKCQGLKATFTAQNRFFSEEYRKEYERSGYIRFLSGADVHKFFAKVLSLNYQRHKSLLKEDAGSFQEYFANLNLFWNEKFADNGDMVGEQDIRDVLFCLACIEDQYQRQSEKDSLREKLDALAKEEIALRDREIAKLRRELAKAQKQGDELAHELADLQEKVLVVVPGDPHHMLGLPSDADARVEQRAKALLKVLHPDRSGCADTAYLFDMVLKARDMILK